MKGKYYRKRKSGLGWKIVLLIFSVILLAAAVASLIFFKSENWEDLPLIPATSENEAEMQFDTIDSTDATENKETDHEEELESINLGYGLNLVKVDSYTGAYMEDGSNEIVSGVMMAVVHNTGDQDIQYTKISVTIDEQNYYFEAIDLAAGSIAILLEKNRASYVEGQNINAITENIALFQDKMDAHEDVFEISGAAGVLNVKNVSGQDIDGDIYVNYKLCINDIYYGGISYRVKIEGGLKDGEIRQLMTGHYNPADCKIVHISYVS